MDTDTLELTHQEVVDSVSSLLQSGLPCGLLGPIECDERDTV